MKRNREPIEDVEDVLEEEYLGENRNDSNNDTNSQDQENDNDDNEIEDTGDNDNTLQRLEDDSFQLKKSTLHNLEQIYGESYDFLTKYGMPNSNSNNPEVEESWKKDPMKILTGPERMTERMVHEFKTYREKSESLEKEKIDERKRRLNTGSTSFHRTYMDAATEAFSEELDAMRHGRSLEPSRSKNDSKSKSTETTGIEGLERYENIFAEPSSLEDEEESVRDDVDIEVLVESLESGMDTWTLEEKELLMSHEKQNGDGLTPHERRRRMFFGTSDIAVDA
mmetsp:Transcript_14723/g.21025  ORF Transcript_14723/g.21025 Transcript_14723/m.21025 type:complete len:281 (+) Transcript_14723:316-1158(+)